MLIMTQEDKELLLKDLSTRLPYGVILNCCNIVGEKLYTIDSNGLINNDYDLEEIKPYLFPLSSMNEEQKIEYNRWKHEVPVYHYEYGDVVEEVELFDSPESFEYLIENHFDYRGLIEKGLAIDATGKNIYQL